jgi:histo-blood group ABO system transferase
MEKIAIITIATGKYISLFNNLQKSIFDKFLTDYEKTIFLFTDNDYDQTNNIKVKKILHLPWPLNTLLRFNYFDIINDELKQYDLIYYIDSDIIVHDVVDKEIFPNNSNEIVCSEHFWEFKCSYPYENNKNSIAYVDVNDPNFNPEYCQACFFGAYKDVFLRMADDLRSNINLDLKNNIISKWHDESHFNKYILNKPKKILTSSYTHPSSIPLNQNPNGVKLIHGNVHCSL